MEFSEIVKARYATKSFDTRKVDDKTMNALLEIIRLAPSSMNLQPWHIKVITDPHTKQTLSPHSWNQPQITSCSHLLVFCADTDFETRAKALAAKMKASGVPAESVEGFSKMLGNFITGLPKEQRLPWAQKQLYLAVSNALNGAKSLGLDSCPMEGFLPAEYAKVLHLPAHLVPTVLVPVGFGNDVPRAKLRFEKKDVFF